VKQTPPGLQVVPVGGVLRFALGQASGPRSNTWSVVGGKRTDEVYLAARDVMSAAKVSMHSSGRWRWAMTEQEAARRELGPDEDRVMWRWVPPAPIGPGWTHAAKVVIPSSSIRHLDAERAPKDGVISYWHVDPGLREVWFDIFIREAGSPSLTMQNVTEPVGCIELPSGGMVWVVGTEGAIGEEREATFRDLRKRTRDFFIDRERLAAFNEYQQPTAVNWAADSDGRPIAIDLGDLREAGEGSASAQSPEPGPEVGTSEPLAQEPECPEHMHLEVPALAYQPISKAKGKRLWWKRYRPSIILVAIGLAMLLAGYFLYPSVSELPSPGYSQLVIASKVPIGTIQYGAEQVSARATKVTIRVSLPPGESGGTAKLTVFLPFGESFLDCYLPSCDDRNPAGSLLIKQLTFGVASDSFQTAQAAPLTFEVGANHFGAVFNGVTASAVIPEVEYFYAGPATFDVAALLTGYKISSAGSYDWSSFEPQGFDENGFVVWAEDLAVGDTQSRVAIGDNHGAQTNDDLRIFLAGAVAALAGAAILAAVQEALHSGDKEIVDAAAANVPSNSLRSVAQALAASLTSARKFALKLKHERH
jgi:hypothetical protein